MKSSAYISSKSFHILIYVLNPSTLLLFSSLCCTNLLICRFKLSRENLLPFNDETKKSKKKKKNISMKILIIILK